MLAPLIFLFFFVLCALRLAPFQFYFLSLFFFRLRRSFCVAQIAFAFVIAAVPIRAMIMTVIVSHSNDFTFICDCYICC